MSSHPVEERAVSGPPLLIARLALDVAALLRISPGEASWSAEIERRMKPADRLADEDADLRAWLARRQAACRDYLAALFPKTPPDRLDDAWARATRLEEATMRLASKQYGYPGTELDDPPEPRLACPGFSADIYGYVYNRVMTELR